ncbi:sugar ABC transporter ATP-binding protein [Agrobacterium rubi]|uniref:sugar ABC transporter ATP-binding protein n=1 Tax=Agrobacterium rubi TaxID=28099 RepID=UPI001F483572|nr:sugar ABC transporter ATP-binding protein [Agrobacterium rubi]
MMTEDESYAEGGEVEVPVELYRDLSTGKRAELAVDVRGLVKNYGEFRALKGVNFYLRSGEVHALMGQNGAGKSTLIKVLAGVETSNGGVMRLFGEAKTLRSPSDAADAGIAVVYQDLSLIPSMTVADNLFLGREPTGLGGILRKREILERARELLDSYGLDIDPTTRVEELSFACKQMTEIAKALLSEAKILILDEPTSALTEEETEVLFTAVRNVVSRGVAVVYVTHRLNEVFALCNRVTVIRDGQTEGTYDVAGLDMRSLAAAIVGPKTANTDALQSNSKTAQSLTNRQPGDIVVELRGVSAERVRSASLNVRKGEIVGLAGQLGSGRTEILEVLFGLRKTTSGTLLLDGSARRFRSPMEAISAGIGLVPEDRHAEGLVLSHSIERNIAMPSLRRLSRFGCFLKSASASRANQAIAELSIKAETRKTVLSALSGGNQQKVVFGKWGNPRCTLLLLDEPTVGVDIGAREEIYAEIRKAAEQGTAVIVVSSDLSELLLLCDRMYVVRNQAIQAEVMRGEIDSEEDLHHRIHLSNETPQETPL